MTSTTPKWAAVDQDSTDNMPTHGEWVPQSPRIMSRKLVRTSRGVGLSIIGFFALLWALFYLTPRINESLSHGGWRLGPFSNQTSNSTHPEQWQKPEDLRVVGLIFYGRQEYASILECYVQRNLVQNGGMLDEVIFVLHKTSPADLEWLESLVEQNGNYSVYDARQDHTKGWNWNAEWQLCEEGSMYIKIDDDVVFIEDSTIRSMVQRKYEHPEYLIVSANVVNQPALSWVHYHLGAVKPYLPELEPPRANRLNTDQSRRPNSTWRPSELPEWEGPEDFKVGTNFAPPFYGHRWLPLPSGSTLEHTPISTATYDAYSSGWSNWTVAAQEHYSFLENLENDELSKYKFDLWDFHYERLSINMIAVMGDDIVANLPFEDDEADLTIHLPQKLGRAAVIEGSGLAAHFGFFTQVNKSLGHGVSSTDLLSRYQMYAEEFICAA